MAPTSHLMSYKIIGYDHNVTEFNRISDIIGPSNKKIKVVFDCVSIYAFGLTNQLHGKAADVM